MPSLRDRATPLLRGMVPPGYSPPLGYRGGPVLTRDGCSQPRAVFQTIGCFRSGPPQQQAGGRQVTAQRHRPLAGLILRSLGTSLRMVRRSRSNELRGTFRPMLAVSRRMAPYLLVRVCEKRTISSHTLNCTAVPFLLSSPFPDALGFAVAALLGYKNNLEESWAARYLPG